MATIIPRWEWRTFGNGFGDAEARIKGSGEPNTRQSSEVYIISKSSNDNTKIRNELMDIKTLKNVDRNKLEQWYPLMKSGFPLPHADLRKVFDAWAVPMPAIDGEVTYERFIDGIVGTHELLQAVSVTKVRHGYTIDDAIVELADLTINGEPIRTVCIEHADPDLVWRVVSELGLAEYENVNYVAAIKQVVGWI